MLNPFQRAVALAYAHGDFAHMATLQGDALSAALKECGDGLFRFIMTELSTSEGCRNLDDAVGRLHAAVEQLQDAADAVCEL